MQPANTPTSGRLQAQLTTRLPLAWFSLAFLAGILLASRVPLHILIWIALAFVAAFFVVLALILRWRFPSLPALLPFAFILVLGLIFGAARYQASLPRFDAFHIAFYNDRQYDLLITGTLIEPPDYRDRYTNLRISVSQVDTGDGNLSARGLLLARVSDNQVFHYGEVVRLRGKLLTPPDDEEFSYRDYLATRNIHSYMPNAEVTILPERGGNPVSAALYGLKERSLENIYRLFPDPEASLLAGILLGVDTGLTRQLQQAFKDTGTAHIIAISGFNISIIAGLFVTLFSRLLGPRKGALLAAVAIGFYTVLVGAEAAVVRAAIMGGFALLARQIGRRQAGLNTLLVVALLMCLWNPLYLWDVGFQLSFFATLGILLYAEPFAQFAQRIFAKLFRTSAAERLAALFSEFVLLTLAAQLTTLPIMAYHFKQISLVAFIANPFILPAQPAVMILGGLAVALSLLWLPLGQLAGWAAWPFAVYTIRLVELFERIPHGTLYLGNLSLWVVIGMYALLFSVTFGWGRLQEWFQSMKRDQIKVPAAIGLGVLVLALLLVWRAAAALPDKRLHVTFLDVGSGDAVLLQTPNGKHVLINGGPSVTTLSDELGRRLPTFNRKLDWLVVAGTDENEVAALPRVVQRYPPDAVLWSGNKEASYSAGVLNEYLAVSDIQVVNAEAGQQLDLGDGATLRALTVGPRGAVLLLEWQNFRALLPIGMSFEALDELQTGESVGPVNVLLLADSGYAASNPPDWITNLNPELVLLSVSAADENGMPDKEVMDSIKGYDLLRTDLNGWIEITTDGKEMWVSVERRQEH